jgi:hypothetical protein
MRLNTNSIFRYRGWDRKFHKKQKGYVGYVNDHHVIPKQFRNHSLVRKTKFDINGNFNLMIMPTPSGIEKLHLDPSTQTHSHHLHYNIYVGSELNDIWNKDVNLEEKEYSLWLFVNYLKDHLKLESGIPWK